MNEFFSKVGHNLSNKFITETFEVPKSFDIQFDNLFIKDVDKEEVLHLFTSQKEDTASGFNKISVKLIKIILSFINDPLIYIYNNSLREGIFPTQFKVAIVKPFFKKGDKQSLGNLFQ